MRPAIRKFSFFLITMLSLISTELHSQNITIKGQLLEKDSKSRVSGVIAAQVSLFKDSVFILSTLTDARGFFSFHYMSPGTFYLHVSLIGKPTYIYPKMQLLGDTVFVNNYPPPCTFNSKQPNSCVGGHKDNIIPIVYGLPSQKMLKRAKRGKIYLGGCIYTSCDPYFYCRVHKREL